MFISKVVLNTADSYEQHQAIWSLFPNTPERSRDHLFRVEDQDSKQAKVLLQSSTEPQESDKAKILQSKPYQLSINAGEYFKFKILALPTKCLSVSKKVIELKDSDEQVEWLQRKLSGANVTVTSMESKLVSNKQSYMSRFVCFEGILHVTDADQIYRAVVMGIGRKKHAGAGLLSLARIR